MKQSPTIPTGFEDPRGRAFQERYALAELLAASPHRIAFAGSEQEGGRPIVVVLVQPAAAHDAATLARFERRVRACARVRHAAIGGPIDSGETLDGKLYLVFERPDGEPLDHCLASVPSGRLPWAAARPLLLELVRGLAAAHARGVVHGALSPACCWVHGVGSDAPRLRLLDAGANTDPAGDEPELSLSRTTTLGGDPVYMAPETAGGVFGDERSDAYLVGLLAWFMLVGRPPFQAVNAFQLVSMHLQTPVPAMQQAGAEVPAAVEAWVRGLLAKEPQQRPGSMTEVEQGILALDELGNPRQVGAEELDKPRGRRGRAKPSPAMREEAVQSLGGSEGQPAQGLGRRLPGQEIVDPRAVGPSSSASPRPVSAAAPALVSPSPSASLASPPVPSPSSDASADELEGTLAFGVMGPVVAAPSAVPASTEPVEATLFMTREEAGGGSRDAVAATPAQADATMMLSRDAVAATPEQVDATMMLSRDAVAATPAPYEATMMLRPTAPGRDAGGADPTLALGGLQEPSRVVDDAANGTMALTMDAASFSRLAAPPGASVMSHRELGAAARAPVDPQRGMPVVPQAYPTGHPAMVPADTATPPPRQGSRLGSWIVIVAILAAVAGIGVGLMLGG